MLIRFALFMFGIALLGACGNNTHEPSQPDDHTALADTLPPCSFQIQHIKGITGSHFKLVSGIRICDDTGLATKEMVLFAEGEPINNHKACNLFATTDTAITWSLTLMPLHINVQFNDRFPPDSTILMKENMVYDSIKITYGLLADAENL